jgi:preprotein translocase subunit YajC
MEWFILALAGKVDTAPTAPTGVAGFLASPMIMMLLVLVLFWVMMIVPQRKQQKQRNTMLQNLKKGDKIITTSGIHGEITEIDEDDIRIRIAEKTEIQITKSAVGRVKG